jgi:hypothetical protein
VIGREGGMTADSAGIAGAGGCPLPGPAWRRRRVGCPGRTRPTSDCRSWNR